MDDERIVDLYWQRSEEAIRETDAKYRNYLNSIAYNILADREDSMECVNDTYHNAWNAMPPHRPSLLAAFLGKITRGLSIDRWRKNNADKRGSGETSLALEELAECVSGESSVQDQVQRRELVQLINDFIGILPVDERRVFLLRYWYMESVKEIAHRTGFSHSKVTSMLHRTRKKLRTQLEKEGY